MHVTQIFERIRPGRQITGMSAILLPFDAPESIDWESLARHIQRTTDAGLVPAVNMDTGFAGLIDQATQEQVLALTRDVMSGQRFVAGAFVLDSPGAEFNRESYHRQVASIENRGGLPIVFPSYGLSHQPDDQIVEHHEVIASECDAFLAFELGQMFAPFGAIYSLDVFRGLLRIPKCLGAKHSSLDRNAEWKRLEIRDALRPDFKLLTGNDLAIDMVMYGSDYLLGLSTFCPELFARRDAMWAAGSPDFFQLNDQLQYLGQFAFRAPVSAYKHDAAMFLHQRGWIKTDLTHPASQQRPSSDRAFLAEIGKQLGISMER